MKKIITTLCVIFVAALGAQGQTTNTFPNTPTTVSFTNLSFATTTASLEPPALFDNAKLLFGITGTATNIGTPNAIKVFNITLSGQGINSVLDFTGEQEFVGRASTNTALLNRFSATELFELETPISSWNSSSNLVSFDIEVLRELPVGTQLYYAVQYSFGAGQINTGFGNTVITAVPEPSTYVAAVGLLGLCLWSARRHLFKFAGSRSTSSGSGSNGAA